jgi:hypothetical protein
MDTIYLGNGWGLGLARIVIPSLASLGEQSKHAGGDMYLWVWGIWVIGDVASIRILGYGGQDFPGGLAWIVQEGLSNLPGKLGRGLLIVG